MNYDKSVLQVVGKRIQKLRQQKGFTQQQFSEMVGISTNYLSDLERGVSSPAWNLCFGLHSFHPADVSYMQLPIP